MNSLHFEMHTIDIDKETQWCVKERPDEQRTPASSMRKVAPELKLSRAAVMQMGYAH